MNNHDLREAVKTLINFLDSRECGESYWVDDEGHCHNADIGYVSEFLEDLNSYVNGTWEPKQRVFNFKYHVLWKWKNGDFGEYFCELVTIKADRIEMQNGLEVKCLPFLLYSGIEVIEIGTCGKPVFTYGYTNGFADTVPSGFDLAEWIKQELESTTD